jgi:lincosamide nucleotidyltransferase A/C/D/E
MEPAMLGHTRMMTSEDVVAVINLLQGAHCLVWIDGGWGVDALLGRQTRDHADLDLAIALSNVSIAQNLLIRLLGYAVSQDEMPTRLDLRDTRDHRIDFHPLVFDDDGNGRQHLPDGRWGVYPAEGLEGTGSINGLTIRCLTPELQLRFHLGYEPDDDDRHDVAMLCEHFGLAVPDAYR